ncbi:unnamed protein product, partial [Rotaria magnacalcarata]
MNNNHVKLNKVDRASMRRAQSFKQAPSPIGSSSSGNNHEENLLQWCEDIIHSYSITVKNDIKSLQNCLSFCAIVHYYRPDLIDFKSLQPDRPISNFQILFDVMQNQLSLPLDRKLQNSLILSMKSSIEERIRQSSIVLLQLLYTHFHHDHHEQQLQRRHSSTPSLEVSPSIVEISTKATDETNKTNNNSTIKVSALVAHYSNGDVSPSPLN